MRYGAWFGRRRSPDWSLGLGMDMEAVAGIGLRDLVGIPPSDDLPVPPLTRPPHVDDDVPAPSPDDVVLWEAWWRDIATSETRAGRDPFATLVRDSVVWRRLWGRVERQVLTWASGEADVFDDVVLPAMRPGADRPPELGVGPRAADRLDPVPRHPLHARVLVLPVSAPCWLVLDDTIVVDAAARRSPGYAQRLEDHLHARWSR